MDTRPPGPFSKEPSYKNVGLGFVIAEFAFALAAHKDGEWTASGTGIVVAPRLLLTAKHVIEDFFRRYGDAERPRFGSTAGTYELHAFQVQPGLVGALWHVTRLCFCDHTDFALLQLTPTSRSAAMYTWRMPVLSLLPPKVGDRVSSYGATLWPLLATDVAMDAHDGKSTRSCAVVDLVREGRVRVCGLEGLRVRELEGGRYGIGLLPPSSAAVDLQSAAG